MALTDCSVRYKQAGAASNECGRPRSTLPKLSASVAASRKSMMSITVLQASISSKIDDDPAARQHAECGTSDFWIVLIMVYLTPIAQPFMRWLSHLSLIPLIVILQMLIYLLEQMDETTFIVGLILWLVFGGYQRLTAPSWLKPPVQSARAQLEGESPSEVGGIEQSFRIPQRLTSIQQSGLVAKAQQHRAVDVTPLVTLGCSPIFMLSVGHYSFAEETAIPTCSPVVGSVLNTALDNHAEYKSTFLERSDIVEHNRATPFDTCLSIIVVDGSPGKLSRTHRVDQQVVSFAVSGQTVDTEHMNRTACNTSSIIASTVSNQEYIDDVNMLAHLHSAVHLQGRTACDTTSDKISGSEHTSDFAASSPTLPSSEECDVAKIERLTNDEDHAASIDLIEGNVIPGLQPKKYMVISLPALARLVDVHKNPTFCEGVLDNVRRQALHRRCREVRDFYNQGETASDFTGIASWPDRSISGDEEDIHCMLEEVWHQIPSQMQHYIVHDGLRELIRTRDGTTGLNFCVTQLELAWHKKNPLMTDGGFRQVTDIKDVYTCQMSKTRNHRKPYPTGSGACSGFSSSYRKYLTDEQEVKINQGSVEHVEAVADPEVSERLQKLRTSPEHCESRLNNPVLRWLDEMEGVEYFDANNHVPCDCGKKAMYDHLEFRYATEPGFNPDQYAYAAPKPGFLQDEALELDRIHKTLEASHHGPAVGFPRCQSMAQICDLHAIPSNNLWILVDCTEDANECLVGAIGDLPAPGFAGLQKYPRGFRIPRGFLEVEHSDLPPRCKHGYLHPPFTDHCNRCFPNGEHDDCHECDVHDVVRAIECDSWMEAKHELACKQHDQKKLALARKANVEEKAHALQAQRYAHVSHCFGEWSPAMVV
ncbi:hypothetical protein EKO04_001502 [Ascochyta lentis]|uniref:Uncharacterized protein n=1 Tax=Ascochyta lentis TaxID=205686 RepID=A0A8H7MGT7_9PLEO|nr:hypothetical protein EKO04_001502 [Ascochyta lentis]